MSRLVQLLDDVLAGRRIIRDPATVRLLTQFAPHRIGELERLQGANSSVVLNPMTIDKEDTATKSHADQDSSIRLTRNEMEAILRQERPATIEEIEWLIAHGNDHNVQLSDTEELELQNVAARLLASRHIAEVRARQQNDEFIVKTLGTYRTEYGDLTRAEVEQLEAIRVKALQAIAKCDDHQKWRCACWRSAREELFELRCVSGEGRAVSMGALAVWNSIDAVASDRPPLQKSIADQQDGPPGIIYNWRHFKAPEYVEAVTKEN